LNSFSTNFLAVCLAQKDDIQVKFLDSDFERRTRNHVDDCVARLTDACYNPSQTVIKNSCILNNLRYFHCTDQSVVDCMHDVLEGIVPYEFQSLVDKHLLNLVENNVALHRFSYSLRDKNSQPPAISLPKFRIQAAESWYLVRNLPLVAALLSCLIHWTTSCQWALLKALV